MVAHHVAHLPRQTLNKTGRSLIAAVQCAHADHVQRVVEVVGLDLHLQCVELGIPLEDLGHIDLLHCVAEVLHHLVKALAQILHLVAAADIHAGVQLAAAHLFHCPLQLAGRGTDAAAEQEAYCEDQYHGKDEDQCQIGVVGGVDAVEFVLVERNGKEIGCISNGLIVQND